MTEETKIYDTLEEAFEQGVKNATTQEDGRVRILIRIDCNNEMNFILERDKIQRVVEQVMTDLGVSRDSTAK